MKTMRLIGVLAAGLLIYAGCNLFQATVPLEILIYDAPISLSGYTVTAVTINYDRIMVHRTNDDPETWITVVSNSGTIDNLLDLTSNAPAVLGIASIPVDRYTQVRIDLASNHTITWVTNGVTNISDLKMPGGTNASIKITSMFDVTDGDAFQMLLDFDAAQSIHAPDTNNGYWQLIPVIRLDKVTKKNNPN